MKLISLALIAAFAVAGSAQAQAPTPAQGQTLSPEQHARAEACKDEMKSLCSGKQGQGGDAVPPSQFKQAQPQMQGVCLQVV